MTSPVVWRLDGLLLDVLTELAVTLERVEAGAYVVTLPGDRPTLLWLVAGEHSVSVEAFVVHLIDVEEPAAVHRWLLARNLRLRMVHFGLDDVGDVFLTGSLPHVAVDVATVDQVLGEVVALAAGGGAGAAAAGVRRPAGDRRGAGGEGARRRRRPPTRGHTGPPAATRRPALTARAVG